MTCLRVASLLDGCTRIETQFCQSSDVAFPPVLRSLPHSSAPALQEAQGGSGCVVHGGAEGGLEAATEDVASGLGHKGPSKEGVPNQGNSPH